MKEKTGWVLGIFFTAWAALISAGMAFQKADDEKQNGLTDVFDLSPAESIFYVKHINGIPSLRSFSENIQKEEEITSLPAGRLITGIDVSPGGSAVAFISVREGDVIETGNIRTEVYILNLSSGRRELLLEGNQAASSLQLSKDGTSLY